MTAQRTVMEMGMKDMVNERIKQLGAAQESMGKISDYMEQVDQSQLKIEKDTYQAINIADKTRILSKEGHKLVTKFTMSCQDYIEDPTKEKKEAIASLLAEMDDILVKIMDTTHYANDLLHDVEKEVAYRYGLAGSIKERIETVSMSINTAVACAEMLLEKEQ